MKALIFNDIVVDISQQEFEVHSSLTWVDCPDDVEIGFVYDGSSFSAKSEPSLSAEEKLNQLRIERNGMLALTDWWAMSDMTMTPEQTAYRQALRDITNTYSSLDDVIWPVKP